MRQITGVRGQMRAVHSFGRTADARLVVVAVVAACALALGTLSSPVWAVDPPAQTESPTSTPTQSAPVPTSSVSPSPQPTPSPAPEPELGTELVELRTADSQTFVDDDGLYVTALFAEPKFYQPEGSGEWQPIDLGFDTMPDQQGTLTADGGPVVARVQVPSHETNFMTLSSKGLSFGLRLPAPVEGQPSTDPSIISEGIFAEVLDALPGGIDLRVFPAVDGANVFLVLHQRPTQGSFTFLVNAPGLTLTAQEDGSIDLADSLGQSHGRVMAPWMVDSAIDVRRGGGMVSAAVAMVLGQAEGLPAITITPDAAFLETATYPVYLDPSPTEFPSAGGSVDTFAKEYSPTSNFHSYQRPDSPYYNEMWLGEAPGVDGYRNRAFIKFSGLAAIFDEAHIDSAYLSVRPYHQYYDAPTSKRTWIKQVTGSWTATALTWNAQPAYTSLEGSDPAYVEMTEGVTAQFDVVDTVQNWMAGAANQGFMLWKGGGSTDREYDETYWTRLIASEQGGSNQPTLTVTWHRPAASALSPASNAWVAGRVLSWTYDDGDTSATNAQSHLQVQVAANSGFSPVLTNGDSGIVASSTAGYTIPGTVSLTNGTTYYWRVRVKDGTGWSVWSSTASFRPDAVAPTGSITAPAENDNVAGTVTVTGTAADANSFNNYTLHYGAGATPSSWTDIGTNPRTSPVTSGTLGSWSTSGLSGTYTIRLRVYDEARLSSGFTEVLRHVTVGSGPVATITAPAASAHVRSTVTVTGTASGGSFQNYVLSYGSGCTPSSWTTIGTSTSPITSSALGTWTTTSLGDGAYTIRLVTTTNAGTATATVCVTVDNTDPVADIDTPADQLPVAGIVPVTGSATDSGGLGTWVLSGGGGTIASGTGTVSASALGSWDTRALSGSQTLTLTVTDAAGNDAVTTAEVYVDNSRRGMESYHTTVPFDMGGGLTASVGVANGELMLTKEGFSIPSFGPPQSLSLSYSSLESNDDALLGTGWTSNLSQYLTFEDGFIVWHRADGGRVPFGNVSSTWTPPAGHFETMAYDGAGAGSYVITLKDQSSLVFQDDGAGRLLAIKDRFDNALTLEWVDPGSATDASSRVTVIDLDGSKIDDITDSAGRAWDFQYTGDLLTKLVDPEGAETAFTYDGGRLIRVRRVRTAADTSTNTLDWDFGYKTGKLTSITDPESGLLGALFQNHTFSYGAGTATASLVKDGDSHAVTQYTYDDHGRVTLLVDAEDYDHAATYDADGNKLTQTAEIDESTDVTVTWTYDGNGNRRTEAKPLNDSETLYTAWTYNGDNDLTLLEEADGSAIEQQHAYSWFGGQLVEQEVNPHRDLGPDGQIVTSYTYTADNQIETVTDALNLVTLYEYDEHGNPTAETHNYVFEGDVTSDQNVRTEYEFEPATLGGDAGVPTMVTDPLGIETEHEYDSLGRVTLTTVEGGESIPETVDSATYDEFGNVVSSVESLGAYNNETTVVYDGLNRAVELTEPTGGTTTRVFDVAGNEVAVDGPDSEAVESTFDDRGLAMVVDPSSVLQLRSTFDGRGNEVAIAEIPDSAVEPVVITERVFDLDSRLSSEVRDVNGLELTTDFEYDLLGRKTGWTDPSGTHTSLEYDAAGHTRTLTTTTQIAEWTYDQIGQSLTHSEIGLDDATTVVDTFSYDHSGRTSSTVRFADDYVVADDMNLQSSSYYDAAGRVVATVDALGVVTRMVLNERGLVERRIDNCTDAGSTPPSDPSSCTGEGDADETLNIVTDFTYDDLGSILTETRHGLASPADDVLTTYEYDGGGRLIKTIVDDGGLNLTTLRAYDDEGRVSATVDPRGTVTRHLYNGLGQLIQVIANCTSTGTTPLEDPYWKTCDGAGTADATWNVVTSYAYDDRGNQSSVTHPNGRVTTSEYDADGRLAVSIDDAGVSDLETTYAYDDAGHQIGVRSPTADAYNFSVTASAYDSHGRLVTRIVNCTDTGTTVPSTPECEGTGTQDAETNIITSWTYDDAGRKLTETSPDPSDDAEGTGTVTTAYAYDRAGRLCRVVQNSTTDLGVLEDPCADAIDATIDEETNVSTFYAYDKAGQLTSMVDGNGHEQTYTYDALGRMTGRIDANENSLAWLYDVRGNRTGQINRVGSPAIAITWGYDNADRMTDRDIDGESIEYTPDANGNITEFDGPNGTITAEYDRLDRLVATEDEDEFTTEYGYDFETATRVDPSGEYAFTLDPWAREIDAVEPANVGIAWQWRADGQLATHYMGGITVWHGYDAAGRLNSMNGLFHIQGLDYTLNRAGQRLTEDVLLPNLASSGEATYGYDHLGRLTSYTTPVADSDQLYTWQSVPNRASVAANGGSPVTSTFDDADRVTDTGYAHDDDGQMIGRPGQELEWDDLGRLVEVRDSTTHDPISTYTYDALDRLLTVDRVISGSLAFTYLGLTTQAVLTGGVTVEYSWSGERMADDGSPGLRVYGTNGHGDVIYTTDGGSFNSAARYDPWGNLTDSDGNVPDWRFQGSWFDVDSGLYWVVARWYAPELGTFVSEDALLGWRDNPNTRHLTAFGGGDPINHMDPLGKWWQWEVKAGDTLTRIASSLWTWSYRWPRIYNPNRVLYRNDTATVPVGHCVWVDKNPYGSAGRCASYVSSVKRHRRIDIPGGWRWGDRFQKAADALKVDWQELLWSDLHRITRNEVGRPENYSGGSNTWVPNYVARTIINEHDLRKSPTYEYWRRTASLRVYRAAADMLPTDSAALTLGNYMFYNPKDWPDTDTMVHEFIHVLQWQSNSLGFAVDYANDCLLRNACGKPWSKSERIAYLWQAWYLAYWSVGEWSVLPWRTWNPVDSD